MNRTSYTWGWLAAGTLTIFACVAIVAAQTAKPDAQTGAKPAKPAATKPAPAAAKGSNSAASLAFRNSVDTPPAGWKGPVFKMSRDYPKTAPKCDAPWLKRQVNFNSADPQWKDWEGYVGHYSNDSPWYGDVRIVLRKGQLYQNGVQRLNPRPGGKFGFGDPESPDHMSFDSIINGRAMRLNFSGIVFRRTFTP